jgi:serine/threonine protein kinase
MPVVATGSFGCVHNPSLRCIDDLDPAEYKGKVSKLMKTTDMKIELEEYEKLEKSNIDPKNRFTLKKPTTCKVNPNNDVQEIKNCAPLVLNKENRYRYFESDGKTLRNDLSLLIMENGGIDLVELTGKVAEDQSQWSKKKADNFWKACVVLFEAVDALQEANYVHYDIKSDNVLYNEKDETVKLIDFGLMKDIGYFSSTNFPPKTRLEQFSYPLELLVYEKSKYDVKRSFYQFHKMHPDFTQLYPWSEDKKQQFVQKLKDDIAVFVNDDAYTYTDFKRKSTRTLDLYALGLTCLHVSNTHFGLFEGNIKLESLRDFFYKCITPNVKARLTTREALEEYSRLVGVAISPQREHQPKIKRSSEPTSLALALAHGAESSSKSKSRSKSRSKSSKSPSKKSENTKEVEIATTRKKASPKNMTLSKKVSQILGNIYNTMTRTTSAVP